MPFLPTHLLDNELLISEQWPSNTISSDNEVVLASWHIQGIDGHIREVQVPDAICVRWGKLQTQRSFSICLVNELPTVDMYFTLLGHMSCIVCNTKPALVCNANQHALFYQPTPRRKLNWVVEGSHQFVNIQCRPGFFCRLAQQHGTKFQSLAQQVCAGQPMVLCPAGLPISPAMHVVLTQLTECSLQGPLLALFLEAKVMELLALQLEQSHNELAMPAPLIASATEYDKLLLARQLLQSRFANPPTLSELSREVGLNEFKLKKGFRTFFGNSVYGWVLNYRLEHAYQLLQSHQVSVSEVAYQVGYQHPAHFTNAFRKKYGIPPSMV